MQAFQTTQLVLFSERRDAQKFAARMVRRGYWFEHSCQGGTTVRRFKIGIGIDFQRDAKLFAGLVYSVPQKEPACAIAS